MTLAVETERLAKDFRIPGGLLRRGPTKTAVAGVDLAIEPGELFVLLGRNGAGKTTLVKLLATLVLPSSGRARVFGHDVVGDERAVRRAIGLASPDERSFYWRLSGRRNLEFWGALNDLSGAARARRIAELSAALGMDEFLGRRFDGYSSGMKQKLAIARALLGRPRLLFLDEPTRSLDPAAAKELRALIRGLVAEHGLTVVLVTHQLDECRELAALPGARAGRVGRFGLMEAGRLRVFDTATTDPASLF